MAGLRDRPLLRDALLAGGVIAATGSHRELMAAQPAYAALMSMEPADVSQQERQGARQ